MYSKKDMSTCYLQETHFRLKNTHKLSARMEKVFLANDNQNKVWMVYLHQKKKKNFE